MHGCSNHHEPSIFVTSIMLRKPVMMNLTHRAPEGQKLLVVISLVLLGAFQTAAQETAESRVVAKGAVPVKAGTGYAFTEGPAVDSKGNVYFTDQPNDRIFKWTTEGKIETYMEGAGRSNGLYLDKEGNIWSCADA